MAPVGRGLEKLGASISGVADTWMNLQTDAQINKALAAGDDAVNAYRGLKGQQALEGQQHVQETIKSAVDDNAQGLTAAQQVRYYNAIRSYTYRLWNGEITTHAQQQGAEVAKSTYGTTIDQTIGIATSHWNNDEEIEHQAADAAYAAQQLEVFQGNGGDKDIMAGAAKDGAGKVYAAAAEARYAHDKDAGMQFLEKHKDQISNYAQLAVRFENGAREELETKASDVVQRWTAAATPEQRQSILDANADVLKRAGLYDGMTGKQQPPTVASPAGTPNSSPVPPHAAGQSIDNYVTVPGAAPHTANDNTAGIRNYAAEEPGVANAPAQQAITQATGTTGGALVPANYAPAVIQIESGGHPQYGGKYQGLGQFSAEEQRRYGITDPNDRAQVERALGLEALEFHGPLAAALGHEPEPADYYMAHQQGIGGVTNHIEHSNQPAWQSMAQTPEGRARGEGWARRAVWGNMTPAMKAQFPGGVNTVTSGDFLNLWRQQYNSIAGAQ